MKKQVILVIGDLHSPAMHKDTVPFLKAIKKKFKPTEVILTGDEINFESFSYHEHNPDLPGPADELKQGIDSLKPIYKLSSCKNPRVKPHKLDIQKTGECRVT